MLGRRELSEAQVRERLARRGYEPDGVDSAVSRLRDERAIDEIFGAIDDHALLEEALARRLKGRERLADEAEFRRLFRYLVGQGFEPDRVMAILKRHNASISRSRA